MAIGGCHDPKLAALVGHIVTEFAHLEDSMASVMAVLYGDLSDLSARYVFRAIVAQAARIKVMNELLLNAPTNRGKLNSEYSDILKEFVSLNNARNTYLHGLWSTAGEKVYLAEATGDLFAQFEKRRRVTQKELASVLKRIRSLTYEAGITARSDLAKRRETLSARLNKHIETNRKSLRVRQSIAAKQKRPRKSSPR